MVKKGNKHQVDSSNSDSESNYEPIGRQFMSIWKEIELSEEVSCSVYRGRCIHCNNEFRCAKPIKTRVHIAHECPSCPEYIKRYYNYIIANNHFDDPNVENYMIPLKTYSEVKRKKFKSAKLSERHQKEIDETLIIAFVSCGLPFKIIENPFMINLLKAFCSEYNPPSREVLAANLIVKYFNKSYVANNLLRTQMEKHKIVGGGLKYYTETRWTTVHEFITILKSHGFFDDIQYLTEILTPIKFAILEVEGSRSNLADCYIALLKIGAIINELPQREYREFENYSYKGARLKFGIFPKIVYHAGMLWKSLGKTQESFESLITQLREYKIQEHPDGTPNAYAMPYTNIAKVHRFNISQTESKARQIENDELSSNSEFYDSEEDDDSQDEEIDQLLTLNSTNTTANDLELEIKTFIDFNLQIFNSSNNNKDDLIDNKNSGNGEENFEDYNPQTIIENMKLDEV
ncbi:7924_t:CDS:2 [Dentiscutata erythropus]|uniref:7924_t:CDS:1 n=1 Tax=Dentiscutata erythropus TaxID=1348616 RepID=A0A9N8YYL8_9GLOM|nr:7924_t:CDS:2 [Dentiscutata erythropus]